jgi:hypothetical protein
LSDDAHGVLDQNKFSRESFDSIVGGTRIGLFERSLWNLKGSVTISVPYNERLTRKTAAHIFLDENQALEGLMNDHEDVISDVTDCGEGTSRQVIGEQVHTVHRSHKIGNFVVIVQLILDDLSYIRHQKHNNILFHTMAYLVYRRCNLQDEAGAGVHLQRYVSQ